jgi:hypothetical protein
MLGPVPRALRRALARPHWPNSSCPRSPRGLLSATVWQASEELMRKEQNPSQFGIRITARLPNRLIRAALSAGATGTVSPIRSLDGFTDGGDFIGRGWPTEG